MTLLLTVLQPLTLMILQQPVLPAIMSRAEPAVAYDALRSVLALFETAPDLLGRHPAAQRQRHMQRAVWRDVVGFER